MYNNKGYVSRYAMLKGEEYKKYKNQKHRIYAEDFADSVKFYKINHAKFKDENPYRAKLISLWGGF